MCDVSSKVLTRIVLPRPFSLLRIAISASFSANNERGTSAFAADRRFSFASTLCDLLKFYGVVGTDFFFSYHPTSSTSGFSKFGLEAHNGIPQGYDYDAEALRRMAEKVAQACGFTLYGGDCIVRPDGSFVLIDFNDFPSFAPCASEAAQAFVDSIVTHYV